MFVIVAHYLQKRCKCVTLDRHAIYYLSAGSMYTVFRTCNLIQTVAMTYNNLEPMQAVY
jgi:hypothetical protein